MLDVIKKGPSNALCKDIILTNSRGLISIEGTLKSSFPFVLASDKEKQNR